MEKLKTTFILLATILALSFTITLFSITTYNDGVCRTCGGHWQFITVTPHRYTSKYLYQCDNCGNYYESLLLHDNLTKNP